MFFGAFRGEPRRCGTASGGFVACFDRSLQRVDPESDSGASELFEQLAAQPRVSSQRDHVDAELSDAVVNLEINEANIAVMIDRGPSKSVGVHRHERPPAWMVAVEVTENLAAAGIPAKPSRCLQGGVLGERFENDRHAMILPRGLREFAIVRW